jgi:hypothetical protein
MKTATVHIFPMRKKEREWEVIRLRSKGEFLGRVTAADEGAARKAAMKLLALKPAEEHRLLIRLAS